MTVPDRPIARSAETFAKLPPGSSQQEGEDFQLPYQMYNTTSVEQVALIKFQREGSVLNFTPAFISRRKW